MKALCLFGVLLFARILILLGRDVPLSLWSPIAYLWQDSLIVLLFAVVERFTARRPWVAWTVYSATALYVALNLPLVRLLSSPITWPMLRATRGSLADSIRHHLTGENLILIGLVLGVAGILPLLLQRVRLRARVRLGLGIAAAVLVALGPLAATQVDTAGLHRNVFLALLETSVPRVAPQAMDADWRTSPYREAQASAPLRDGESLSRFKGAAKGRHVVLILLESTAAQYLRPYGAAEDPMPNLTRLASRAVLFEDAYAVYPESIKGLFSVLCSRYPAFDTEPEVCARVGTSAVAERLAACVSPGDLVARLGGDEFVILISDRQPGYACAQNIAERVLAVLADPFPIGGDTISVAVSIGIAIARPDMDDAGRLLAEADLAMYAAKRNGKGRHTVFDASVSD